MESRKSASQSVSQTESVSRGKWEANEIGLTEARMENTECLFLYRLSPRAGSSARTLGGKILGPGLRYSIFTATVKLSWWTLICSLVTLSIEHHGRARINVRRSYSQCHASDLGSHGCGIWYGGWRLYVATYERGYR